MKKAHKITKTYYTKVKIRNVNIKIKAKSKISIKTIIVYK